MVKRLKAVTDSRRGKVFSRISRDLTLAAKSGGGDPDGNARLRTLVLKAREANMPADNVERAIKKGTGELPGVVFEEITYEGYGPGGVAFVARELADVVLFVVKWSGTPQQQVKSAITALEAAKKGATPLMLVLNQQNPRTAGYGAKYGSYYGYN